MSKLRFATLLFFVSTFVLKFSSMIREVVIANYFGSTAMASAYFAAMTIPNAFILFMLTGMKEAFLPSYYKFEAKGKGFSHLTNILKGTFWISLAVSIIGIALSPFLMPLIYPKWAGEEEVIQVAIWTSIIYFGSVFLVGINAVYEGYFDSQKKFSFSTFSQTIVVLCTIGGAMLLHTSLGIYSVPLGYLIGTVLSFLIKLVYVKPKNFLDWKQSIDRKEVYAFYLIFLPVGLTIAVGQVNLFVNTLFSAQLEDKTALANLNYAFRLVNIPQAVFGVTIATIIFPIIARAKTENNMGLFKRGIEKGLSFMFLLLAPTVAGMIFLMQEVVQIVYQRGAFGADAASETAKYAVLYTGSVVFYSIQAVIAKGFYTLEKGHYMLKVGIISIICNVILNAILSKTMGASGLALSFSLVGFIYSAITFTTLYRMIEGFSLRYVGSEYMKMTIATAGMLGVLWVAKMELPLQQLHVYLYVAIMGVIGALVYFILLWFMKSQSVRELINLKEFRRQAREGR
ncbi:murein biosynthesis integral membrane protein MurJ [Bacillus sp. CGMCC 1.16541]|uniref:murein biosynthesis integral membrane protein MurJ n=1 Tax=Bacillus sp. CGMCC 1.16541 TaxID=2185143 RepID=UPI000D72A2AC|nr:murein biosynthesis integral membrane protein MurJ [Bacillus sp. CGMCC 1.16541]